MKDIFFAAAGFASGKGLAFLDYAVVAAFFAVMIGVGVYYARRSKNASQFFGGDKSVPWWLSGVSFYMNSFSALAFVMYSALAYKYGWVPVTVSWLSVPAVLLALAFVSLKWRRTGSSSPIEYIARRFSRRMNQTLVWLGIPMQVLDGAFKLLAIGTVVGLVVRNVFPADYPIDTVLGWAIAVSGAVIIAYTFMGGLKAALMCDFIQFFVILAVVVALPVFCLPELAKTGGGTTWADGFRTFLEKSPKGFFDFTSGMYDWTYMFYVFVLVGLNLATTWSLIQRYSSTKSEKDAKKMGWLVSALLFFGPPLFFFPAMAARVFIPDLDLDSAEQMNGVYAIVCLAVLPAGMIGMMVAAMFSATMSTLAGMYNAIANVLTRDVYGRVKPDASPKQLMVAARIATVLVGGLVIGITFYMRAQQGKSDLFDLSNKMFSVFLPPIAISMLLGILSRRESKRAGLAGLVGGIGVGFVAFVLSYRVGGWEFLREMKWMTPITAAATFASVIAASFLLKDTPEERADVEAFMKQINTPDGEG